MDGPYAPPAKFLDDNGDWEWVRTIFPKLASVS